MVSLVARLKPLRGLASEEVLPVMDTVVRNAIMDRRVLPVGK